MMLEKFRTQRAWRMGLFSVGGAFLVLGILVLFNVLGQFLYFRLDLSQGRIYSLSPASKKMLKNLEDPVLIKVFFSEALPAQYSASRTYLRDLLKEYKNYSKGKVRYEFFRESDPESFRSEALKNQIASLQFNIVTRENFELREAFMGLVLQYEDKKEVIAFLQDVSGLEYDLSSRIKKLASKEKKAVGIVRGYGAMTEEDWPPVLKEKLEASYRIVPVDLKGKEDALSEIDSLILAGPREKIDEAGLKKLKDFVSAGKPAALFLDVKKTDLQSFMGTALETGLEGWLSEMGVKIKNTFVLDLQCQKISITSRQGFFSIANIVSYPPFVISTELDRENLITKDLQALTLPFAAPLEIDGRFLPLARSSPQSWSRTKWEGSVLSINPTQDFSRSEADPAGPFVLAAVNPKSRLLVVGTSRLIAPGFPLNDANIAFFLNAADYLAQDPDLSSIRSKAVAFRPLTEIPPEGKTVVKYADVLGAPLIVAGFGILRWKKRRKSSALKIKIYS